MKEGNPRIFFSHQYTHRAGHLITATFIKVRRYGAGRIRLNDRCRQHFHISADIRGDVKATCKEIALFLVEACAIARTTACIHFVVRRILPGAA